MRPTEEQVTNPRARILYIYGGDESWQNLINAELDAVEAAARAPLEARLAEGMDVERLARAIARVAEVGSAHHLPEDREDHWESYRAEAEEYAREYAALETAEPQP